MSVANMLQAETVADLRGPTAKLKQADFHRKISHGSGVFSVGMRAL
jgi:hypothetical protein